MLSPHLGEIPRSLGCRGLAVKIQEVHANLQEIPVSRKVAQIHCITEKWFGYLILERVLVPQAQFCNQQTREDA